MLRTALSTLFLCAAALSAAPSAHAAVFTVGGGLVLECPPIGKVFCGTSTDPSVTGEPTATSDCPGPITFTYQDSSPLPGASCPGARFAYVILRTWTATDACGNTASCVQAIDVVRQVWKLDIKPTSCPNPINVQGSGNAAVSIALLGTSTQDVANIDPTTVSIWREDCVGGPVLPLDFSYQDVAAPWVGGLRCGCTTDGPDGITDLRFRFGRADLVQGLNLGQVPQWTYVRLVLTGRTFDGCEFVASDCVRVQ